MLYKFINERKIEKAPPYIKENGIVTSNPTEEKLIQAGYMEVVEGDYTDNSTVKYTVENGRIIKSYIPFEDNNTIETIVPSNDATKEFFETLSSTETNSIAKIRAAAQTYLDATNEQQNTL